MPPGAREQLYDWFEAPLGRSLQALESACLREVLPTLFGRVAIQIGRIGRMDLMDASLIATRGVLDTGCGGPVPDVWALAEALPLDTRSVDLCLLPHTLDFAEDPHQVLRETQRVLAPEGHLVLLGFNPLSLWGLRRVLGNRQTPPWSGRFIQLSRIKDWLMLLDFEWVGGQMLYYRPPLTHEGLRERLHVLERIGDRWWPLGGAVYLLVARRRIAGMMPLRPAWKRRRALARAYPAGARRA